MILMNLAMWQANNYGYNVNVGQSKTMREKLPYMTVL